MSWNSILGVISSVSLFLPVILILLMRLSTYKTFPALAGYYLMVFVYNILTEGYISANTSVVHYIGLTNNIIDAPLMLFFLTYFSSSAMLTKRMHVIIIALLVFGALMLSLKGFSVESITIIMAPGLLAVFSFCCYFFVRQSKITIMQRKSTGKALIVASLLFAYGCYAIIYLMYYIYKTQYVEDTFIVYHLVTTFSSLLLCVGLIVENKRVQKLEELKITRKELELMYKDN